MTAPLFHYTCDHGDDAITAAGGMLAPNPNYNLPGAPRLLWCTPEPTADADALGLTSHTLSCDRTRYRWRLDDPNPAVPWVQWLREQPRDVRRAARHRLPGSPLLWWVSLTPVHATRSPILTAELTRAGAPC